MIRSVDVIVVGLGVMGSAATFHLARRGHRIFGFDAFPRGHDCGSSYGKRRLIRTAYYEAPDDIPLVQRSWSLWREVEEMSGCPLLCRTGGLYIGRPEAGLVSGALLSAREHGLPHEVLDTETAAARFPGPRLAADQVAV